MRDVSTVGFYVQTWGLTPAVPMGLHRGSPKTNFDPPAALQCKVQTHLCDRPPQGHRFHSLRDHARGVPLSGTVDNSGRLGHRHGPPRGGQSTDQGGAWRQRAPAQGRKGPRSSPGAVTGAERQRGTLQGPARWLGTGTTRSPGACAGQASARRPLRRRPRERDAATRIPACLPTNPPNPHVMGRAIREDPAFFFSSLFLLERDRGYGPRPVAG